MNRTADNVRTYFLVGLVLATLYALYAVGLFALRGSTPFEENRTSLSAVLLTYYLAGGAGGALVGALLPLNRTFGGSLLIGLVAGAVFVACILVATDGPFWLWRPETFKDFAALSVLFGVGGTIAVKFGPKV